MVLSKEEAAQALHEIDGAHTRTLAMQRYRNAAPYFVVWGCVWLVANCITDIRPSAGGNAWNTLAMIGVAASVWLSVRTARHHSAASSSSQVTTRHSWQMGLTWLVVFAYLLTNFSLLPHLDAKQGNTYISLFWAFLYVLMGIWTGWRICIVGLAAAAAILIGYFALTAHYFLWMGLVTGGLLILGGLWLRKI